MFGKAEGVVLLAVLGVIIAASLIVAFTSSVSFALATLPIEIGLAIGVAGERSGGILMRGCGRSQRPHHRDSVGRSEAEGEGIRRGVREPRRPVPTQGSGAAAAERPE